ncbi:hypothetical protein GQX74_008926 [Glossina fuscipes]|nr:hypothetical protein GQX74_008926 [Glossina fuscipes]
MQCTEFERGRVHSNNKANPIIKKLFSIKTLHYLLLKLPSSVFNANSSKTKAKTKEIYFDKKHIINLISRDRRCQSDFCHDNAMIKVLISSSVAKLFIAEFSRAPGRIVVVVPVCGTKDILLFEPPVTGKLGFKGFGVAEDAEDIMGERVVGVGDFGKGKAGKSSLMGVFFVVDSVPVPIRKSNCGSTVLGLVVLVVVVGAGKLAKGSRPPALRVEIWVTDKVQLPHLIFLVGLVLWEYLDQLMFVDHLLRAIEDFYLVGIEAEATVVAAAMLLLLETRAAYLAEDPEALKVLSVLSTVEVFQRRTPAHNL